MFDLWSIFRRSLARAGEITFLAQIIEALGFCEGLNALIWQSDNSLFYVFLAIGASALMDLFDVATRPDIPLIPEKSCNPSQQKLPSGDEK